MQYVAVVIIIQHCALITSFRIIGVSGDNESV